MPESEINQGYMDMALTNLRVIEKIVQILARTAKKLTQYKNLDLAGGVALNSVANGKLSKENIFENIWIQPAAGDIGESLGTVCIVCLVYI